MTVGQRAGRRGRGRVQRRGYLRVRAHRALGEDGGVFVIERDRERVGVGDGRVDGVVDAGLLDAVQGLMLLESIPGAH